jgi:hypothetical protein
MRDDGGGSGDNSLHDMCFKLHVLQITKTDLQPLFGAECPQYLLLTLLCTRMRIHTHRTRKKSILLVAGCLSGLVMACPVTTCATAHITNPP